MSTQERLVEIGEMLIVERGYNGFSYADVARDAGIRKASIHHHFPVKADLGLAVVAKYARQLRRSLADITAASRSGGQALEAAIQIYREAVGNADRMCLCSALAADTGSISDEMRRQLAATNQDTIAWLEDTLLAGRRDRSIAVSGDPAMEAKAILAQLQGAQLLARAALDPDVFDQAISTITARISRH